MSCNHLTLGLDPGRARDRKSQARPGVARPCRSNVSRARKLMGYSRQQFDEVRRNYQTYGAEG